MKKLLPTMLFCLLFTIVGSAGAADNGGLSDGYVKVGVLTDLSGAYKTSGGPGTVIAAQMAINDFGGTVLGQPVKLISADHQNKPSVASSIAREWIDEEGVDMIVGLINSAAALAVQRLASNKHTITMATGAGTIGLTEDQCTKYGIHYVYDTYSLPVGTATAIVKNGGDTWFFITADYAFGHSLQKNTTTIVEQLGGKILGGVQAPLGTTDFASYLIQAKASDAEIIALANAGADTVNTIKQAHAFHIVEQGQKLAAMVMTLDSVKALGVNTAQGLLFTSPFYWDRTDESRKWSKRFFKKHGAMPTMFHAGTYSAVTTYLKAVKQAGTDNSEAVRKSLGDMTINDMFVAGGMIEPNGLMKHDMFLMQVKSPDESQDEWDLLKVVSKIPADEAFIPLSESSCPLLDK